MARDRPQGFTRRVRQELAAQIPERACDREAQLAALVALAGRVVTGDPAPALEVTTTSGGVARDVFRLLQATMPAPDAKPVLRPDDPRPGGRRRGYTVVVRHAVPAVLDRLGLRSADEDITVRSLERFLARPCDRVAFARGALLAAGSVSGPGRPPHLEIVTPTRDIADAVARAVAEPAGQRPGISPTGSSRGWRVVVKSGETIATLIAALGAQRAFLDLDEYRLRRQLRSDANRLANADAANLRRAADAAAAQVAVVERAIERVGWTGLEDDLRQVALARLANPEASIAEVGEFCDPPVGKSTVHRRISRIEQLAADGDG